MVCPQKESMIIKASIFLLATLLMFFIATIVIAAQPEPYLYGGPATQEEDSILKKAMHLNDSKSAEAFLKELSRYVRDGCKQNLAGQWCWEKWPMDWIQIDFNKEHQVFEGIVAWRIGVEDWNQEDWGQVLKHHFLDCEKTYSSRPNSIVRHYWLSQPNGV
jgi:hypothetical protein